LVLELPLATSLFCCVGEAIVSHRWGAGTIAHADGECIGPFSAFAARSGLGPDATNEQIVSKIVTTMISGMRTKIGTEYIGGEAGIVHTFRADIIATSTGVTFDRVLPVSDIMNWVYGNGNANGAGTFSRYDLTQNRE
jgi:hypothetical protein